MDQRKSGTEMMPTLLHPPPPLTAGKRELALSPSQWWLGQAFCCPTGLCPPDLLEQHPGPLGLKHSLPGDSGDSGLPLP